jgi:tRNA (guanine37-N1)-methyltransferase
LAGQSGQDRGLSLVRLHEDLDTALAAVSDEHGQPAALVATSARNAATLSLRGGAQVAGRRGRYFVVLGTGHGLADAVLHRAERGLPPLRPFSEYNHLSVRAAAGILTDRLLGDTL